MTKSSLFDRLGRERESLLLCDSPYFPVSYMHQVRGPETLEPSLVVCDDFVGPDDSERVLRATEDSFPSVLDTQDLEHCRRLGDDGEGVLGDGVLHLGANFRVDSSSCGFDSDATSLVEL